MKSMVAIVKKRQPPIMETADADRTQLEGIVPVRLHGRSRSTR